MAKAKKKVIVDVTLEMAEDASRTYAEKSNKLDKIAAKLNEDLNRVKSKYADEIKQLQADMIEPIETLEVFATEQKKNWGKKKSMELLHCIIGFRTGTPKVDKSKKFTWDAVMTLLKKNKLGDFIRTTETINKEAILAEKNEKTLKLLKDECFVFIEQDESFYVQPKVEELEPAL